MTRIRVTIAAAMLFTFFMVVWGMMGDCPYRPEGDEMYCVDPALQMARDHSFNPHWLAHPASTTIYPLLLYYHLLNATYFHGTLFGGNQTIENIVYDNVFLFCYLPRFANALFLTFCVPLVYLIARQIFSRRAGLIAICLFAISPLVVSYSQVIRSECPALFFSLVALYACIKLYAERSLKWQILASVAIGLGVSSRYPMLALLAIMLCTDAALVWLHRKEPERNKYILYAVLGTTLALVTFAMTTPYLFLDFETFKKDIIEEKAAHGLGCDGLPPLGNFLFYIAEGIPREFGPVQSGIAWLGMLIALLKRSFAPSLLILYLLAILAGTSLHPFHSDRWLVPIIPILAIFAASGLDQLASGLERVLAKRLNKTLTAIATTVLIVIFLAYYQYDRFIAICATNTVKIHLSTEPLFYKWMFEHVPAGSSICFVGVWEGGHRERYKIKDVLWDPTYFDRACGGKYQSPLDIYKEGYKYFVWTDNHCPLYLAEPNHYPRECRFFHELFDNTKLIKEFAPEDISVGGLFNMRQRGATFRLYEYVPKGTAPKGS